MKTLFTVLAAFLAMVVPVSSYAGEKDLGPCKVDKMDLVGDKRFSFSGSLKSDPAVFSDIGCAVVWRNGLCAGDAVEFDGSSVVYDYLTGEEIKGEDAFYVMGSGVETPFGFGIIAFKDKPSAQKFVSEKKKGSVLKLFELNRLGLK